MFGDVDIDAWFGAVRAAHLAACVLVMAVFAFECFVLAAARGDRASETRRRWRTIALWLLAIAIPAAVVSGAAWFAEVAASMSGLPLREAMHGGVPSLVWNQTRFGFVWKLRTIVVVVEIVLAAVAALPHPPSTVRTIARWLALVASAALVASLVWAGHGQTGGPPGLHLPADILHLLVCGLWPGGLLPLALLLISLRKTEAAQDRTARRDLVRRFSAIALLSVAALTITGAANAWLLVGSWSAILSTTYGLVLVTKIGLFAAMIALGAANFLRIRSPQDTRATGWWVLRNVIVEVMLAAAILGAVGVMGMLPPPAEHLLHEHTVSVAGP